jgi:hypothetical protein
MTPNREPGNRTGHLTCNFSVGQRQNPFDLRLLTSGGGLFPG